MAAQDVQGQPAGRPNPEAGVLVDDIDSYVAKTDPQHLAEAEAELADWSAPDDPSGHPIDAGDASNVVGVFSAYSEIEASIVKGVLDAAGIPAAFDNHGGSVMGGIFAAGDQVWADVVVPESYGDAAKAAIAEAVELTASSTEANAPADGAQSP
jgi:hypothetical protein